MCQTQKVITNDAATALQTFTLDHSNNWLSEWELTSYLTHTTDHLGEESCQDQLHWYRHQSHINHEKILKKNPQNPILKKQHST